MLNPTMIEAVAQEQRQTRLQEAETARLIKQINAIGGKSRPGRSLRRGHPLRALIPNPETQN